MPMPNKIANKVVLAYSGGLDTSVAIRWLLEHKCNEVICVAIDLGQGMGRGGAQESLLPIRDKALAIGASASEVIDAREEFINNYCFKGLKANAQYESGYPLATAIARPLIAKLLVDTARKHKADAIGHGCTGKGNDQVRFDVSIMALAPEMQILAPAREWGMSREECMDYARQHDIPVPVKKDKPFSIDLNLWGRSTECGVLEDSSKEAPEEAYGITTSPELAPQQPEHLRISFERGVPVAINGKKLNPVELVNTVNEIGGKHGIGRIDQIENRVIGIKSREIYESPAGVILNMAHEDLEYLTMIKEMKHFKKMIDLKYSEMIYSGRWFNPLRESLDAFIEQTQERVTGTIGLKLYKGKATVVTRESPFSLYDQGLATYDKGDTFNHQAAIGFIELFGLDMKTYYQVKEPVLR